MSHTYKEDCGNIADALWKKYGEQGPQADPVTFQQFVDLWRTSTTEPRIKLLVNPEAEHQFVEELRDRLTAMNVQFIEEPGCTENPAEILYKTFNDQFTELPSCFEESFFVVDGVLYIDGMPSLAYDYLQDEGLRWSTLCRSRIEGSKVEVGPDIELPF